MSVRLIYGALASLHISWFQEMHHLREIIRPRFAEKLEPRSLLSKDPNGKISVMKLKILSGER
jgi:hypothetical protein